MEAITQIGQMLGTYGVSAVIVIIFLWDYVANKKKNVENQETIKTTLEVVKESTSTISNCLIEMQQTNLNTAKSLELLQKQMESTDKKVLEMMKKQGVNRLSFGVQSAQEDELKRIGRIHSFAEAKAAVDLAREKGFDNISLDLMYGLPGQTQEKFLDSVEQCLALGPKHLSCYGLKLEPATPMGRENPALPDDDAQADTYLAMCELLRKNGFEHYEISNFAKPGFRSRHNSKYWDLSEYLGLGPGAHSFINGRRFEFARDIKAYINGEDILRDEDEVPTFQRQGEYLMVRLRTAEGVDFIDLEKRYNVDSTPYEEAFRSLMGNELVAHQGTRWYLTEKGFLVSNSIINTIVEAGQEQMESPAPPVFQ